ncbi:MAG TPA: flagellin [Candidatus Latescibacteria bacterium]|nr:flagellin [Candidatus Latescibacterota bacterium]
MKISHNLLALQAHRHLKATQDSLEKVVQKLSSGLRINTAADDAAGLAISERMRAQISSTEQATRNANYALNLLQTAEGSLNQISGILIRMRELAVEASAATMTDEDRSYAQQEFDTLRNEITRIAQVTEYNAQKLIDGSLSSSGVRFQIDINNVQGEDWYRVTFNDMTASGLQLHNVDLSTVSGAQSAIAIIDSAIDLKDTERIKIGSYIDRLTSTIANLQVGYENLVASESQIRDADIALEMAEFVRNNILMKAGVAMVAQANMLPETVASLLKG